MKPIRDNSAKAGKNSPALRSIAREHRKIRAKASRRLAIVVLQQPAQALLTANFGNQDRFGRRTLCPRPLAANKQLVIFALMRAKPVVVFDKDRAQVVQVPLTENNEVVKALLAERLD
jgi:hypothetical protein